MRRWVVNPLASPDHINMRLDAIQNLVEDESLLPKIVSRLKKLPDLEVLLSRIYMYSIKTSERTLTIDLAVVNKLEEFAKMIDSLKSLNDIIKLLSSLKFKAERLQ